ncbi:MAG: hypothetical protein KDD44_08140, partial [Bdellovibrionales bacterium]|nr:hypothetical protein [Bdellovibrionales bacterium]
EAGGLPSLRSSSDGSAVLLALRNLNLGMHRLESQYAAMSDRLEPQAADVVELPLRRHLQSAVDLLLTLLGNEEPIVVTSPTASEGGQTDDLLSMPRSDVPLLLSSILGLVQELLPHAPELAIEIAAERLTESGLRLLPGTQPGDYVRIVLHHGGKSLTAKLNIPSQAESFEPPPGMSALERSMWLLAVQARRLGGFTSAQTASVRGTTVTIYLPRHAGKRRAQRTPPTQRHRLPTVAGTAGASPNLKRALIASDNAEIIAELTSLTTSLGIDAEFCTLDTLSDAVRDELFTSGVGFDSEGASEPREGATDRGTEIRKLLEAGPLLVLLDRAQEDSRIRALTVAVRTRHPEARLALVADAAAEDAEIPGIVVLQRPASKEDLKVVLDLLLHQENGPS